MHGPCRAPNFIKQNGPGRAQSSAGRAGPHSIGPPKPVQSKKWSEFYFSNPKYFGIHAVFSPTGTLAQEITDSIQPCHPTCGDGIAEVPDDAFD